MQVKENPPQIRVADIPTVVHLSQQIPELVDPDPAESRIWLRKTLGGEDPRTTFDQF